MDDRREKEGFLSRWSKRKLTPAADEAASPEAVDAGPATISGDELTVDAADGEQPFDISTLPTLESLTGDSDLSIFLQRGVPEELKNAALRKVWSADPFIRDHTGPVDYGWDFNDPAAIPGFGPIGEGTDVAALLRQAIGEVEPVSEAPIDVAAEIESDASKLAIAKNDSEIANKYLAKSQDTEGGTFPHNGSDDAPLDKNDIEYNIIETTPSHEVPEGADAAHAPVALARRRHGGAVPG